MHMEVRPIFNVDGTSITLSRGDTGAVRFRANATIRGTETEYKFKYNDRAVFTIKSGTEIVKEKIAALDENNCFTVTFFNADTDTLSPGGYNWDVRYVINPYWEDAVTETRTVVIDGVETEVDYVVSGRIVDGDQVVTPNLPMNMQLLTVVGDI